MDLSVMAQDQAVFALPIRILHLDDDPDFASLAASYLERENESFEVLTETSVERALETFQSADIDCIVSDYDMPRMNGIEFLQEVRSVDEDLPFILFTGKGSEEIASDAIAAGVTDYIQKSSDASQYTVLANRIVNSVSQFRATRRLERAERRFRRLIEKSTDVITVVDESGQFRYISPAVEGLLGYAPDDLADDNAMDYVHPDDRDILSEYISEIVGDGDRRQTAEFRFRLPDGSWTWLEVQGRDLLDDEVVGGIVVYARDIADRKDREARLSRSFDLLRHTEDLANTGGWEVDVESKAVRWTAGTKEIHDVPDGFEPTLDEAIEFYHPDDRQTIRRALTRCIEEGIPFDEELRIQTATGRDRWIHVKGEPIREHEVIHKIRGAIQDVTDLIEHQRNLEEVRDRMEYVLDVTDSFIWEADLDTGEVTRHGPFEELFGIEPSEIRTPAAFRERAVHPEDRESLSVKHEQATSGAQQVDEHIYRTNPENGQVRWILERPHVTFSQDDRDRIVGLSTDVSAQVAHEQELERKNEQLEEFAGIVSHDLRNPMSTAIGYLELFRETGEQDHLAAVEATLRRMDELTKNLISLVKLGQASAGNDPVSIQEVARAAWGLIDTDEASLTVEDCTISGERSQLQSLLENLFNNAVIHGGPDVSVDVGPLQDGFYVQDNGRGIQVESPGELFTYGFSTHEEGTGLGLAIVRQVADAHGFSIDVADGPDGGARFEFRRANADG